MINLKNILPKKGEPVWVVPSGAVIDGDMSTRRSLRIDGIVTGNVHVEERLVIGPGGQVTGNIDGGYILVQGKVVGNITGNTKVFVTETAVIEGLIDAPEKDIREGASVKEAAAQAAVLPEVAVPAMPVAVQENIDIIPPQTPKMDVMENVEKIWTPVRAANNNTWF